jgi:hypothetical protein
MEAFQAKRKPGPPTGYWYFLSIATFSPLFAFAFVSLLTSIPGCHWNEGSGGTCVLLSIDFSGVVNFLGLFAAWGWIGSLPSGLILLIFGFFWTLRDASRLRKR